MYFCTLLKPGLKDFFMIDILVLFPGDGAGAGSDLLISVARSGAARIMVSPLLLDDAHELHPRVVLRVAPHAPALPHGGGRSSVLAHTRSWADTGPHTTEALVR